MPRTSPVHYIAPSAISIIPNANGSQNDLAVSVAENAKIKVFSAAAGINTVNGNYQEWLLSGLNRRLANSDSPYTIYARLQKNGTAGYLVFAPKVWDGVNFSDKYPCVTKDGLSIISYTPSADVISAIESYWFIRLGDVSLPEGGLRSVSYDTGILGTDQYNEEWELNPDELPLRVEITNSKEAGVPYVAWEENINIVAKLVEGWDGSVDAGKVKRWTIRRDTGDAEADAAWNFPVAEDADPEAEPTPRTMTNGQVTLSHAHDTDDFNGAPAAAFVITAWGEQEPSDDSENSESSDSSGNSEDTEEEAVLIELASAAITILAETAERYELALSTHIASYSPVTEQYSPSGGIDVRIRAVKQDGSVFFLTQALFDAAQLTVLYVASGASDDSATELEFAGTSSAEAKANIPISAFAAQKSLDVRLRNAAGVELSAVSVAFVRDGEDGNDREWIYRLNSKAGYDSKVANRGKEFQDDEFVPVDWTDDPVGVSESGDTEYASWRDHDNTTNQWGDFHAPVIWSHYGADGSPGGNTVSIFRWNASGDTPPAVPTSKAYPPAASTGWYKSAPNRTDNGFLWMSTGQLNTQDNTVDEWATPVRISGDNGTPGEDGDGTEWIYKKVRESDGVPALPATSEDRDGYVPEGWSNHPQGVDSQYIYEYACYRTQTATGTDSRAWGAWRGRQGTGSSTDAPILWSHYGRNGMDGDGTEYVFMRTKKAVPPVMDSTQEGYLSDEFLPNITAASRTASQAEQLKTTDEPAGPDETYPYEWVAMRSKASAAADGSRAWTKFTGKNNDYKMSLWSKWAKDADVWTIGDDGYWYKNGEKTDIKAEGSDGTGVQLRGSVDVLYSADAQSGQTSLQGLTGVAVGDCYVVNANRHLYFYTGEGSFPDNWKDLGEFKGEPGENSYMHIAYAEEVTLVGGVVTAVTGFSVTKQRDDYPWIGLRVDHNETDPGANAQTDAERLAAAKLYEWNYVKGADGTSPWVADLDNEMDSVACDTSGKPASTQEVKTTLALYYGSNPQNFLITAIKRNGSTTIGTGVTVKIDGTPRTAVTTASLTHEVAVAYATDAVINGKDDYEITLADADNTVTRMLHFTVNGIRPGANGDDAVIYNLKPSLSQISVARTDDGGYTPTNVKLTCGYVKNVGGEFTTVDDANSNNAIDGKYYVYYRMRNRPSGGWGATFYRYNYGSYHDILASTGLSVASNSAVEFVLCTNNSLTVAASAITGLIDRETVPVVADGQNGENGDPGEPGEPGEDAYALTADPPSVTFECNSSGICTESAAKEVELTMYKGADQVDFTPTVESTVSCIARVTGSMVLIYAGVKWKSGSTVVYTEKDYPQVAAGDTVYDANGKAVGVVTSWGTVYIMYGGTRYSNPSYRNLSSAGRAVVKATAGSVSRSVTIPVVGNKRGADGTPGSAGAMLYPAGVWEAKTYRANGDSRPYVLYQPNNSYYYLNTTSASASDVPGTSSKWTLMTQVDVVFAKFGIMDYGKMASSIFCGDWMYSQYGKLYTSANAYTEVNEANYETPYTFDGNTAVPYAWFNPEYPQGGARATFAPNWAVNLRTGESFQGAANISGTVTAENFYVSTMFRGDEVNDTAIALVNKEDFVDANAGKGYPTSGQAKVICDSFVQGDIVDLAVRGDIKEIFDGFSVSPPYGWGHVTNTKQKCFLFPNCGLTYLPAPSLFPGKMVEVYNHTGSTYNILCADSNKENPDIYTQVPEDGYPHRRVFVVSSWDGASDYVGITIDGGKPVVNYTNARPYIGIPTGKKATFLSMQIWTSATSNTKYYFWALLELTNIL